MYRYSLHIVVGIAVLTISTGCSISQPQDTQITQQDRVSSSPTLDTEYIKNRLYFEGNKTIQGRIVENTSGKYMIDDVELEMSEEMYRQYKLDDYIDKPMVVKGDIYNRLCNETDMCPGKNYIRIMKNIESITPVELMAE